MTPEKGRRGSAVEALPLSSPLRYAQGLKSRGSFFGLIAFGVTSTILVALYLLIIGKKDHLSACWLYENDIDGSCGQVIHPGLKPLHAPCCAEGWDPRLYGVLSLLTLV